MTSSSQGNADKLGALPIKIPNSIRFADPAQGPLGERKEFRLPAESTTYASNSNNIVRFFFNTDNIIDFARGGIAFDVTISAPGATYVRVANGIWSIFNRLRLTTGQELEDIREYGRLHSFLFESYREPDVADVLGSVYGFGTQAERNTWGTTPNKDYMMPCLMGLFLSGVLPMEIFSQRLQLEMYMEDPRVCLETDSTGPLSITLTNTYFHYEVLTLQPSFRSEIIARSMSGVRYPYKSFVYYTQPVISAQSDLLIPHSSTAIDGFINLQVQNNNIYSTTVNDKYLTWLKNGCLQHQLRINNEFYPLEPTIADQDPQSYLEFLRWIQKWQLGGVYNNPPTISFEDYDSGNKFVVLNQLETFPGDGLFSTISTNNGGNNVFLRLWLSAAPAVPTSLITFAIVGKTIDFYGTKLRQ